MGRGARRSWGPGGEARRLWASPLPPLPGAHAASGGTGSACPGEVTGSGTASPVAAPLPGNSRGPPAPPRVGPAEPVLVPAALPALGADAARGRASARARSVLPSKERRGSERDRGAMTRGTPPASRSVQAAPAPRALWAPGPSPGDTPTSGSAFAARSPRPRTRSRLPCRPAWIRTRGLFLCRDAPAWRAFESPTQ